MGSSGSYGPAGGSLQLDSLLEIGLIAGLAYFGYKAVQNIQNTESGISGALNNILAAPGNVVSGAGQAASGLGTTVYYLLGGQTPGPTILFSQPTSGAGLTGAGIVNYSSGNSNYSTGATGTIGATNGPTIPSSILNSPAYGPTLPGASTGLGVGGGSSLPSNAVSLILNNPANQSAAVNQGNFFSSFVNGGLLG